MGFADLPIDQHDTRFSTTNNEEIEGEEDRRATRGRVDVDGWALMGGRWLGAMCCRSGS